MTFLDKHYLTVFVLIIMISISAEEDFTKIMKIDFGNNEGEINYLSGGMVNGVFKTDKYNNLFLSDHSKGLIRVYNKDGQIIDRIPHNYNVEVIEKIRVNSNENMYYMNSFGQMNFLTGVGEEINSYNMNSNAGQFVLLENEVIHFEDNNLTGYSWDSAVVIYKIEQMEENLSDFHNIDIKLDRNIFVDENLIIYPSFLKLKKELSKINPDALTGPSVNETPSLRHVDRIGTSYWSRSYGKERTDYHIYDKLGNLLKKITLKASYNERNYIAVIGYWGDFYYIKQIGLYSDKYVHTDEGSRLEVTKPKRMEFYYLKNTWNNLRGDYYTEIARVGLNSDNSEEILSIIETLDKEELRRFRNTLFAIKGYMFNSEDLDLYFRKFDWYKPDETIRNSKDLLNPEQEKLFDLILKQEQKN